MLNTVIQLSNQQASKVLCWTLLFTTQMAFDGYNLNGRKARAIFLIAKKFTDTQNWPAVNYSLKYSELSAATSWVFGLNSLLQI